mgnify:FL=1
MHYNYPYPSCGPLGLFYSKQDGKGKNNPCFIIKESYKLDKDHCKDFEFVIPQNGFVITLPYDNLKTRDIFSELLPQRLKQYVISNYNNLFNREINAYKWNQNFFNVEMLPDELNNIKVKLSNNKVLFLIPEHYLPSENQNIDILLLENNRLKKIAELELRLYDLEDETCIINNLDERISKLENK